MVDLKNLQIGDTFDTKEFGRVMLSNKHSDGRGYTIVILEGNTRIYRDGRWG